MDSLHIPDLLRRHGLTPRKGLGQNFLINSAILQRVVDAAAIAPGDVVLEIGPGVGNLTRLLAASARQVTAVELDKDLLPVLHEVLAACPNVRLLSGDILQVNPADLFSASGYLVVANIPYNITSAIIRHLLEAAVKPQRMVLTVQREVAERIVAAPGELSLLALSVQVYGSPRLMAHIPAGAFYPAPDVDSAVLRIDLYPQPLIPPAQLPIFFRLTKAGFSQKRKTLRNALSAGLGIAASQAAALLLSSGIDPMRRAETVSIVEWGRLAAAFATLPAKTAAPPALP